MNISLGEKLKKLRKGKGMTQHEIADAIPISFSTYRRWEKNERPPELPMLSRLSNLLETSVAYLSGETDNPAPPKASRATTPTTAASAASEFRRLPDSVIELPVYSITACMGSGFDNEGEQWAQIGTSWKSINDVGVTHPEKPYIILADGDSMEPKIFTGDKLVINPNIMPGRGEICFARFRSGGWLKDAIKYYHPRSDGGVTLKASETSGVPPLEFTQEEVQSRDVIIVGRVMYIDRGERL